MDGKFASPLRDGIDRRLFLRVFRELPVTLLYFF
jgi:hypothetical protein